MRWWGPKTLYSNCLRIIILRHLKDRFASLGLIWWNLFAVVWVGNEIKQRLVWIKGFLAGSLFGLLYLRRRQCECINISHTNDLQSLLNSNKQCITCEMIVLRSPTKNRTAVLASYIWRDDYIDRNVWCPCMCVLWGGDKSRQIVAFQWSEGPLYCKKRFCNLD